MTKQVFFEIFEIYTRFFFNLTETSNKDVMKGKLLSWKMTFSARLRDVLLGYTAIHAYERGVLVHEESVRVLCDYTIYAHSRSAVAFRCVLRLNTL